VEELLQWFHDLRQRYMILNFLNREKPQIESSPLPEEISADFTLAFSPPAW